MTFVAVNRTPECTSLLHFQNSPDFISTNKTLKSKYTFYDSSGERQKTKYKLLTHSDFLWHNVHTYMQMQTYSVIRSLRMPICFQQSRDFLYITKIK